MKSTHVEIAGQLITEARNGQRGLSGPSSIFHPLSAALLFLGDSMITYRFYRHYVDMVDGSVNAAVMLAFAVDKQVNLEMEKRPDESGFWKFTREDWFKSTGLSRSEQETCRSILKKITFWNEKLVGLPAVMSYRVNLTAFSDAEKGVK